VVAFLAQAGAAVAQPVPAVPAAPATSVHDRAAAAFEDGRKLLARHQPSEACARFAQAIKLEPGNVGVMLNLGLCNEQLDRFATALTWFRAARARAAELGLAEAGRAANDQIATLAHSVPTVRIALSPPAAEARVTIDGAVVRESDLERVELDAGHHVIEIRVAGATETRKELDVADGVATVELVVPHPSPAAPVTRPEVAAPRVAGDPMAARRRAYLAGAIGGGLVLGSLALGLEGRSASRATEHPDVQRDWKLAVRYGGTSMFVVGGAALGWAIWRYVRAPGERSEPTIVGPAIGDHSVGLGARGAF
jgi:hypothetical protein